MELHFLLLIECVFLKRHKTLSTLSSFCHKWYPDNSPLGQYPSAIYAYPDKFPRIAGWKKQEGYCQGWKNNGGNCLGWKYDGQGIVRGGNMMGRELSGMEI